MTRSAVDLPSAPPQLDQRARPQQSVEVKTRAILARGLKGQGVQIPSAHRIRMPGRDPGLETWKLPLEPRVSAAVVAMKVGIDQHIERTTVQVSVDEGDRLAGMAAITTVNQCCRAIAGQKDVVG